MLLKLVVVKLPVNKQNKTLKKTIKKTTMLMTRDKDKTIIKVIALKMLIAKMYRLMKILNK